MRNNLKHFLIGALIAAVPMSYVVYNNIPHKPAVTMIKTPQNTLRAEEFLWSSKLSSPKKAVKLSSVNLNIQVSAWTFTKASISLRILLLTTKHDYIILYINVQDR